jgi:hypothetical protein
MKRGSVSDRIAMAAENTTDLTGLADTDLIQEAVWRATVGDVSEMTMSRWENARGVSPNPEEPDTTIKLPTIISINGRKFRQVGEVRAFHKKLRAAAVAVARAKETKQALENGYQQGLKEAAESKERPKATIQKPKNRGVDGRGAIARRFKDVTELLLQEISSGGEALSTSRMALVRQAVLIITQSEAMQLAAARGEEIDGDVLVRLSNLAVRILGRLERQIKAKGKSDRPGVQGLLQSLKDGT